MSVSPEQQLRAYVEYFRDLGVFELYRRESPQVGVPERWHELLARPKPPTAQAAVARAGAPAAGNTQRDAGSPWCDEAADAVWATGCAADAGTDSADAR